MRVRGVHSTTMPDEEACSPEGWTSNMPSSADVAFSSRVGPSENFRPDESALGYFMQCLGLHSFKHLVSSSMAYKSSTGLIM